MIDQDLDLCPQRKRKMQKHTDWKIEKHLIHSRKLLSKYTQKKLHSLVIIKYLRRNNFITHKAM